ncbi:MAG: TonB-dependent receptor [Acidobacteriota bacterium]
MFANRRLLPDNTLFMVIAFALAVSLSDTAARGQADTGAIIGVVRDSQSAVIHGVRITTINTRTNQSRTVITDDEGNYRVLLLPVGEYRIAAEAVGFKRTIQEKVVIEINQTIRADFSLGIGEITEEAVVSTEAPLMQSETATVGTVINNRRVVDLPLNGRDFLQLNLLVAGAVPGAEGSQLATQGGAINVNGARESSNNFLLDGIDNNDLVINQFVVSPSIDAIQEFQLQSSTYSSEFGRSGGAQINVAIKSGTNSFHGSAYEFIRNASLDAKNFFDPPDQKIPKFQRNQFGGTIGGPIRRNHTFFFFNYEGTRIRQAITRLARVPTVAEKSGDFSQTDLNGDGRVDADDVLINPATGNPYAGNRIPQRDQDEIGAAIAKFFPDPNRSDPVRNFVSTPVLRNTINQVNVRVDHRISQKDTFFARYSYSDEDRFNPFDPLVDPTNLPGFGSFTVNRGQSVALNYTHLFSPTLINEFRFGFNRLRAGIFQQNQGNDIGGKLGIPGLPRNPRDFGFPAVSVIGFDRLAEPTNLPQDRRDNTFQYIDNLSLIRGKHSLKFGGDIRRFQANAYLEVVSRGLFIFAPVFTNNSLGDLLLGLPVVTVNAEISGGDSGSRTTAYNFFAQDDFKVSRNLTLNLGLRYEYNQPPIDVHDRGSVFDFATASLKILGTQGVPRSGIEPDRNNFAPRIGFAWRVRGHEKMVLRGGYGVFYDVGILNNNLGTAFNPPFFTINQFFSSPASLLHLDNPFPNNAQDPGVVSVITLDRHLRDGYLQQWSLTAQREIASNLVIDIGYVGSKGTKLLRRINPNQPRPGTDPDVNARRPIPTFGDITVGESSAASVYHALQLRAEKRFSQGLSFLAAYTWSKSIDDASALFGTRGDGNYAQDRNNLRAERGLSNFDTRHRFTVSYIYELPFGRGKRFLNQGHNFADTVAGGWQITGIIALQSGQPFTPQLSFDNSGAGSSSEGGFSDRPDVVGNHKVDHPGSDGWFNVKAFAVPPPGTFGNAGRNILIGPSFKTVDVGLFKQFTVNEQQRIQFRAEFFNLFNHPNFNLPNRFVDQPTAGKITSAKSSRQIQFALKYIF